MNLAEIKILDPKNILNVLLSIIPISFIAGNLIINLNLLSIIYYSRLYFMEKKLNFIKIVINR